MSYRCHATRSSIHQYKPSIPHRPQPHGCLHPAAMPLHSLCSSAAAAAAAAAAAQLVKLSARPLALNPTSPKMDEFPLPLPELPRHVKEKILSLEILGVDAGRALALNPDLRAASLDSVHSVVSCLISKGIHHKDLARILGMCPKILTSSISDDLSPVFNFLSRHLKVPESNLRKVIIKCPRLLTCSVRDQLKPALIYLQSLGFVDTDALAYHDPILLVSNVENTLAPKLRYLMDLGMPREEAIRMVLRCPALFTFSIEKNFEPKYDYFTMDIGGSLEELKDFPQYFTFSLEKRIKPRHRDLKERGLKMPLSLMLKSTDEGFRELIMGKKCPR